MSYQMRDIRATANALVHEIREHGAPNSFGPAEIHSRHLCPRPMVLGQIGNQCCGLVSGLVREHGLNVRVRYANRRFIVEGCA